MVTNGTGAAYFPAVLAGLPVTVVPMFDEPDGRFPNHAPNPLVEANLDALKGRVLAEGADLGLCFDGDADRVMAVDERGCSVSPDLLIGLLRLVRVLRRETVRAVRFRRARLAFCLLAPTAVVAFGIWNFHPSSTHVYTYDRWGTVTIGDENRILRVEGRP